MNHTRRLLAFYSFIICFGTTAYSSTLTVSIPHHMVVAKREGKQRILRTVFLDDSANVTVKLDVYALPQMPSTAENFDALRRLSRNDWWQHLKWNVRSADGLSVAVTPRLVSNSFRERGPNARNEADRDTSVACSSYQATFEIGSLPAGDFSVQVEIGGLKSAPFLVAVRTGLEGEVRDVYLQERARKTTGWPEYKEIQLERLRLDPTKAAALLELAQRSLEHGTLQETNDYYDRAVHVMQQNIAEWAKLNPSDAKRQARDVEAMTTQIRALQRVLPEYFERRSAWRITMDGTSGRYVILRRDTGARVRVID